MGTDIHMYYEVKKNDKWELYDFEKDFVIGTYEDGDKRIDYDKLFEHKLYVGRNYNLFSILANVRNGYGFAGCVTSSGFEPFSMPKGLPLDVSPEVKTESDNYGIDGHSHSWFLLSDLMTRNYNKTVTEYGYVIPEDYKIFLKQGMPETYCGDVSGRMVRKISNEEMNTVIMEDNHEFKYYTQVSWEVNYATAIGESWFLTLAELNKLADDPTKVRLVFWFDN